MSVCPNFFFHNFCFEISEKMVKQMAKIERARALGYLQAGWNISQVAEIMGRHKSAISRLAMKATELGEERAMVRRPGGGIKNLGTVSDIKKLIRLVQKRHCITAKSIKRLLGDEGEKFSVRRIRK